jgi:hypothetical protein
MGLVLLLVARGARELIQGVSPRYQVQVRSAVMVSILTGVVCASLGHIPRLATWYTEQVRALGGV